MNIANLLTPICFAHPVTAPIQLVETHISWVILTGEYAYKIKKPVQFPFVDYHLLSQRKYFCEQEVALNQVNAHDLYLSVVPITYQNGNYCFEGAGEPVEYAVKMRQFSDSALLSAQILTIPIAHALAAATHQMHRAATTVRNSPLGEAFVIHKNIVDNFRAFDNSEYASLLPGIEAFAAQAFTSIQSLMNVRNTIGFVRICHGDLHLGNVISEKDQLTIFDRIEFNEALMQIDLVNDYAFMAMDLWRTDPLLAWEYLNQIVLQSGDYEGLRLLWYYLAYRAMVRAKIAYLSHDPDLIKKYISLATQFSQPKSPCLYVAVGPSGSGKSTKLLALMRQQGGIILSSDQERLRRGFSVEERYSPTASKWVYDYLAEQAEILLQAGITTYLDATHLRYTQRERLLLLAIKLHVPCYFVVCNHPTEVLRSRIEQRLTEHSVSEATVAVLEQQLKEFEPLRDDEKFFIL